MGGLRDWLKGVLPAGSIRGINYLRIKAKGLRNRRKSASEVFDHIYATGAWAGGGERLSSGFGSRGEVVDFYVGQIAEFMAARNLTSIVDIGCGDFHVAGALIDAVGEGVDYTGIDVSNIVIANHTRLHARANVRFICGDATEMGLPDGDVCLIRQVLQHLSNAQIAKICRNCAKYRYVIVTEHYPPGGRTFVPNRDKVQGADTRLLDHSAVVLDRPPFNLTGVRLLFEVPAKSGDPLWGSLVTVLVENEVGAPH